MATEFPLTIPEARAIYDGLGEAEKGKLRLLAGGNLQEWADVWDEAVLEQQLMAEVIAVIRFEDWETLKTLL